jgi:hypothetical protein
MTKLRHWIISLLLTHDEQYMIYLAIESRASYLKGISVNQYWADKNQIDQDLADYQRIKSITV